MGEAKRRRAAGLTGMRPNPVSQLHGPRHVLAMIDRRVEHQPDGEVIFSDHSAKPNTYASADLKTLYRWDGVSLRRLDRLARTSDNPVHSPR